MEKGTSLPLECFLLVLGLPLPFLQFTCHCSKSYTNHWKPVEEVDQVPEFGTLLLLLVVPSHHKLGKAKRIQPFFSLS